MSDPTRAEIEEARGRVYDEHAEDLHNSGPPRDPAWEALAKRIYVDALVLARADDVRSGPTKEEKIPAGAFFRHIEEQRGNWMKR